MAAFFPLYVNKKYNNPPHGPKEISEIQIAYCFSAFEIACVSSSKFNSVTISKMGRKNSLIFGLGLLVIANLGIGTLYYMPKNMP
jgi:hypothetical protein